MSHLLPAGRAFVFGDDIDTDVLAPGVYMKGPVEILAAHCLEALAPGFATRVRPGDFVVGRRNFGIGSSREQAAQALRILGVAAVIAQSFGGIFQRNALNLGLPVLICPQSPSIADGDRISVDAASGIIRNETTGAELAAEPLPDFLLRMVADGGLVPHLERRFNQTAAAPAGES